MQVVWFLPVLVFLAACGGGEVPVDGTSGLDGTLWMQQSAEYRAAAMQTYAAAGERLDQALADPSWTAALEQAPGFELLPPAVILDVDETVLESTTYTAQRLAAGEGYTFDSWRSWVEAGGGRPVPGSLAFCTYALSRDVAVIFVTNNRETLKLAVTAALRRHGYPVEDDGSNVVTRSDVRDKGPRRRAVAATHRILLMVGDDGNDFASDLGGGTVAERAAVVERYEANWGRTWFMLPNPMYGTWENALFEGLAAETAQERLAAKRNLLETD